MTEPMRAVSANEALKSRFQSTLAYALVGATFAHAMVFQLWPTMEVPVFDAGVEPDIEILQLDDIPLPAPPKTIARPAAPVIGADVPLDATMDVVAWNDAPDLPPPPPPPVATQGAGNALPFTPVTVMPRLTNAEAFQRALQAAYPRTLRDAGIGGEVVLALRVDEEGLVTHARVVTPSDYEAFQEVALELTDVMRFRPALNRQDHVAVWVSMPIVFEVR